MRKPPPPGAPGRGGTQDLEPNPEPAPRGAEPPRGGARGHWARARGALPPAAPPPARRRYARHRGAARALRAGLLPRSRRRGRRPAGPRRRQRALGLGIVATPLTLAQFILQQERLHPEAS